MFWNQLQLKSTAENAEFISDLLTGLGAAAVTLIDANNQPLLEPSPGATPLWDEAWVSGLFTFDENLDQILSQLKIILCLEHLEYRIIPLANKDWAQIWLEHFHPMQFSNHLWITPQILEHTITDKYAIKVILDPGLAFGTGTHPTTALCLEWLANYLKPGQTMMDYGCGSGILALAAIKLGAKKAYAIDNDPQALEATQANMQRNQITFNQIQTYYPNELSTQMTDIVIANIVANPLLELAEKLINHCKPNGRLVLSGILSHQINAVKEAYQPFIHFAEPLFKEDWVCLHGEKISDTYSLRR